MENLRTSALDQLRRWADRDALPHALILSGGNMPEDGRYAAAALECRSCGSRPCGACRDCRKVFAGIHPDVITAEDGEHKNLSVETVRRLRSDAYIRPNEGVRKVYLFPDCTRLTEPDQNVLLKLVEEGPPYTAFLFCVDAPERLLKTLRSRCVHLPLAAAAAAEEDIPEAQALCQAFLRRDKQALVRLAVSLERRRLDRETLSALLDQAGEALSRHLRRCCTAAGGTGDLSPRQTAAAIETLRRCRSALEYNGGTGHVLGALTVEWEAMI